MIINNKFFSLPPYLSSTWDNVFCLTRENGHLLVCMKSGKDILIPELSETEILEMFQAHQEFMKSETAPRVVVETREIPLRFAINEGGIQHNPEQSDFPDLPQEVLEKLTHVAKTIFPSSDLVNKPELNCNCPYCQVSRSIINALEPETKEIEEAVPDEELAFSEWQINPEGEKLYSVVNKLNEKEKYSVFLGYPVGCTCGKNNCEHIVAVLKS